MHTQIIKINPIEYNPSQLDEAASILTKGGLVIFPTETVYGIGCNAKIPEALEKLYEIKGRPKDKPFTIHIANIKSVEEYVSDIPPLAKKLINRYWPGPLTLILTDRSGNKVGLRLPDHKVALDLIMKAGVPVAAPSANLSGEPPATTGEDAFKIFDGKVDVVIDTGPTAVGMSSTIVEVQGKKWHIIRSGSISEEEIQRLSCFHILFVCTGNTCRSPMAEALLRMRLSERLKVHPDNLEDAGIVIRSAGTGAIPGIQASEMAVEAMRKFGCEISFHIASALTMQMCDEADKIYVMSERHRKTILEWMPHITEKICVMDPSGNGIPDPVGSGIQGYWACANAILSFIDCEILKDENCFGL